MTTPRQPARIETIAAESEKFTSPLLFVHGLFGSSAGWRRFMGYSAHRGWTCHALNLPRGEQHHSADHDLYLQDLLSAVTKAAGTFDPRPVLIGHDLGGLLALASTDAARAVVALAPLPVDSVDEITHGLLSGWRNRLAALQSRSVTPSPGRRREEYLCGADALGFVVPEPSGFLREVGREIRSLKLERRVPILIVGAENDVFATPQQLKQLADQLGAEFAEVAGARHGLPWDKGWERTVALVHRWLVQTFGEQLLIPPEDEEDS